MSASGSGAASNLTAAQAIVTALGRHGVEFMLGQSNPISLFLAAEEFGLRQIAYRTETRAR